MLQRKGRLRSATGFYCLAGDNLRQAFQSAPLTHEIALAAEALNLHGDPADRFIAATAQVLDLTLVTADRQACWVSAAFALWPIADLERCPRLGGFGPSSLLFSAKLNVLKFRADTLDYDDDHKHRTGW